MPLPPESSRFSPELRASLFHFSVFTTSGAASAYFGVWMAEKGISPAEIGIINAAPLVAAGSPAMPEAASAFAATPAEGAPLPLPRPGG